MGKTIQSPDEPDTHVARKIAHSFTEDELRNITTFDAAMDAVAERYGGVEDISSILGNGFTVLSSEDKKQLCGVSFIIVDTRFHTTGSYGAFVTVAVVTKNNQRYMVNDGSTGIADQLESLRDNGHPTAGLLVYGGLHESTYSTCDVCGVARPDTLTCSKCGDTNDKRSTGTTYYLDLTAAP